ncbi:hypothetical protein B296_00040933 [Ensete ventricosum]|uniref:Uncharacterized protein n=1 Tax=Ensete ventricosum TaxID=4639 RepID=A0A426XNT3_ENSVE|nr:hypothetical protein B296_00040933 [Ensete ventricosum]
MMHSTHHHHRLSGSRTHLEAPIAIVMDGDSRTAQCCTRTQTELSTAAATAEGEVFGNVIESSGRIRSGRSIVAVGVGGSGFGLAVLVRIHQLLLLLLVLILVRCRWEKERRMKKS